MAEHIIKLFPVHTTYVEVFGGAGHVLMQKPPSNIEVFNDIDSDIANLFRVLRHRFDEFNEAIKYMPYSRELYPEYISELETETDSVRRAALWFAISHQSYSGIHGNTWRVTYQRNSARQYRNHVDDLEGVMHRLRNVQIENRSFEKILSAYDWEHTLFYLDPPYVPDTRRSGGYKHEMTLEDHELLVEMLKEIKGKFILSGYRNELYDSVGWKSYDYDTVAFCSASDRARVETLWTNYDPDPQGLLF